MKMKKIKGMLIPSEVCRIAHVKKSKGNWLIWLLNDYRNERYWTSKWCGDIARSLNNEGIKTYAYHDYWVWG